MILEYPNGDYKEGKCVILFYAGYNSNCNMTINQLNILSEQYKEITMIKINTTKYPKEKNRFNIHVIPSYMGLNCGNIVFHLKGNQNILSLKRNIEKL